MSPPPQLYGSRAGREHRTPTEDEAERAKQYWDWMAQQKRRPYDPRGFRAVRSPGEHHVFDRTGAERQAGRNMEQNVLNRPRSSERRAHSGPRTTDPHSSRYYYNQRKAQKGGVKMSELDLSHIRDMHKRGLIEDSVAREYGLPLSDKGSRTSSTKATTNQALMSMTGTLDNMGKTISKMSKFMRRSLTETMDDSMEVQDSEDQDDVEMTDFEDIPATERQTRFAQADPEAQLFPALNAPRANPEMFNYNAPPPVMRRGTGFQALGAEFVKGGEKFARGFKKVQRKADQVLTGRVQRSSGSSGGRPARGVTNAFHEWALRDQVPTQQTPPLSRAQREEQKENNYHAVDSMAVAGARAAGIRAANRNAMRTSPRKQPLPRGQARMDRHENH